MKNNKVQTTEINKVMSKQNLCTSNGTVVE